MEQDNKSILNVVNELNNEEEGPKVTHLRMTVYKDTGKVQL